MDIKTVFMAEDKKIYESCDVVTNETKGTWFTIPENCRVVEQSSGKYIMSYKDKPCGEIIFDCWKHGWRMYRVYAYESFGGLNARDFMSRTRNAEGLISLNSRIDQDSFPISISVLSGWAKRHEREGKSVDELRNEQRQSIRQNIKLSEVEKSEFLDLIESM